MSAVFENENFIVAVETKVPDGVDPGAFVPQPVGYMVINKETGVVEFRDPQIANAISYAEHGNSFLKHKLWRMVAVQGEQSAAFLDKQGPTSALDDALSGP